MYSIPPNGSSRPEIEKGAESPLKKRRINSSFSIKSLGLEVLVHIVSYLKPKQIFPHLAETNRLFRVTAYTCCYPKWKKWVEEEFPESYASFSQELRNSKSTDWYEIYKNENRIRKNIVAGKYDQIHGDFIPELHSLHQAENLYITHNTFSIEGWTLNATKVFSLSSLSFTCCTTFQNLLFIFNGFNQIQVLKVPTPSENTPLPLQSLEIVSSQEINLCPDVIPVGRINPHPIQEAKVQWPYLIGFAKKIFFLWNMNLTPATPIKFKISKLNLIGIWDNQIIYLKKKKIISLNIETRKASLLFDLNAYRFKEFHMDGPRILCSIEPENIESNNLLFINLLDNKTILLPSDFPFSTQTFIYNAHFYWCDASIKVLGAFSLDCLTFLPALEMKENIWEQNRETIQKKNSRGLEFKLFNDLVFMRDQIVSLANSTLSHVGNTLCAHNYYALDYSKVVYLNGCLVRGYPCTGEGSNIQIFNFNPKPDPTLRDPMDIT